ncbi:MAG: glycosyltransferase, partial [Planctomycetota bacterium]
MRIAICQPGGLPRYRLPAFDLLGRQEGIELTIFAHPDRQGGGAIEGLAFRYEPRETRGSRIPGLWHQPVQLEAVDPDRFDFVVLPWNTRCRTLRPALRLARRRGVPVALWGHGVSKRPGRIRDALRLRAGRRAGAVLVYTHTVAKHLVDRAGFTPDQVFVAQNAIDQRPVRRARNAWTDDRARLDAFRAEHRLVPDRTVIHVSRLLAENRPDLLLHGVDELRRDLPDCHLVLIGDGPERGRLQRLAGELDISDHVTFAGPIYDDDALAPWMLSAAVFGYPVNIGLSIMHAFGYGLPVVTSADMRSHGPEIEALEPGHTGLLYRDGDARDMAARWGE